MKRILIQQPEPLLLVVPILLFLLNKVFADGSTPGIDQLDTGVLFWIAFTFIVTPVQLHYLLRASRKWDPVFCRPHVYLTAGLMLLLFLSFYSSQPLPKSFFDIPPSGRVAESLNFSKPFAYMLLGGFMLQFLFVIYFLARIFQKK